MANNTKKSLKKAGAGLGQYGIMIMLVVVYLLFAVITGGKKWVIATLLFILFVIHRSIRQIDKPPQCHSHLPKGVCPQIFFKNKKLCH